MKALVRKRYSLRRVDQRLQAREAADEIVDALDDLLGLVDQVLVGGEAPDGALPRRGPLGDLADVVEHVLELLRGAVDGRDGRPDLAHALVEPVAVVLHDLPEIAGDPLDVGEDLAQLRLGARGHALDVAEGGR